MSCMSNYNCVHDVRSISRRYGVGGIVIKDTTVDGVAYRFECSSIDAIDLYMNTECVDALSRSEMDMFLKLATYEDTGIGAADIIALDNLLNKMVLTGEDCITLQGANCG